MAIKKILQKENNELPIQTINAKPSSRKTKASDITNEPIYNTTDSIAATTNGTVNNAPNKNTLKKATNSTTDTAAAKKSTNSTTDTIPNKISDGAQIPNSKTKTKHEKTIPIYNKSIPKQIKNGASSFNSLKKRLIKIESNLQKNTLLLKKLISDCTKAITKATAISKTKVILKAKATPKVKATIKRNSTIKEKAITIPTTIPKIIKDQKPKAPAQVAVSISPKSIAKPHEPIKFTESKSAITLGKKSSKSKEILSHKDTINAKTPSMQSDAIILKKTIKAKEVTKSNEFKKSKELEELKTVNSTKTPKGPKPLTSFKFRVYFNKKDDEKSIIQKNEKLSRYINIYLNNRKFLESLMKTGDATTEIIPIQFELLPNFEDRATSYIFNVYSPNINDSNIGTIIQNIQEKFFQAEEKGLFKNFVFVV